jgi:hypothetical protein
MNRNRTQNLRFRSRWRVCRVGVYHQFASDRSRGRGRWRLQCDGSERHVPRPLADGDRTPSLLPIQLRGPVQRDGFGFR